MKVREAQSRMTRLADCCRVVSGATPRTDNPSYWDGDIPWVTPKDLGQLDGPVMVQPQRSITKAGVESCSTAMIPKGSILFSSRAPIGHVAIAGRELCTNQGFKSLVPDAAKVDSGYLYHCMKRFAPAIAQLGRGATFKEVSKPIVEDFEIPLPPLPEQRRIAAILDEADAIRRKRAQAAKMVDDLLRSVFLEMFGDPVTNPKGWPTAELATLVSEIGSGWSPVCEERAPVGNEWGVLKLGAVTRGDFSIPAKALRPGTEPVPELEIRPGDVLLTRKNTYDLVGTSAYVDHIRPRIMLPDLVFRLGLAKGGRIQGPYLWQALSHPRMRSELTALAGGTAGSMPNISKGRLGTVALPVPPEKRQAAFGDIVVRVRKMTDRVSEGEQHGQAMTASLANSFF